LGQQPEKKKCRGGRGRGGRQICTAREEKSNESVPNHSSQRPSSGGQSQTPRAGDTAGTGKGGHGDEGGEERRDGEWQNVKVRTKGGGILVPVGPLRVFQEGAIWKGSFWGGRRQSHKKPPHSGVVFFAPRSGAKGVSAK